jgi:UDPglucose 6-dehydrogenase
MAEIYRPLYLRDFPIVFTGLESAEMIKYAANAFLATKITFINEIAALCERVGADIRTWRQGHGPRRADRQQVPARRPRLRRLVLSQGHPALARIGQDQGLPIRIVETVIEVNDR